VAKDLAINDFSSNIHHRDASQRGQHKPVQCRNCGKPEVHVELGSCQDPACVKIMRKVKRWSDSVLTAIGL
jgi:hypothetical protein